MWQFWVDRGGTFTDIVAKPASGGFKLHKLLSEHPDSYQDAVEAGIKDLMGVSREAPFPAEGIGSIKMGTTVATNALLERKGAPTALLITQGFKDVLLIGYQDRPNLFDLNIRLDVPLYQSIIEVKERVTAQGEIIDPLDETEIRHALEKLKAQGIQSIAVALMHSYSHGEHEQRIGEIAQGMGFDQISLSHQVNPLIKLVSRAETCVVDAYLSPVLASHIAVLNEKIKGRNPSKLLLMQSNGGLAAFPQFQGKDAILSGPAGGVVGMAQTALADGFKKIIGFDMGGTSTDVCHYSGAYERAVDREVAGVRISIPMMNIHTVASGGGSILSFKQGRLQVGPESAGAYPGPACYRLGGPATVTDCNVVLGKIQPSVFPSVFGSNGSEPLDPEASRDALQQLAVTIGKETGTVSPSIERLAEDYLLVAVDNMANAIKKISTQRGYDLAQYVLNAYGGAGGQHACQVAELLGMSQVYIHPFAGVLSALGVGLADIRVIKEYQALTSLDQLRGLEPKLMSLKETVLHAVMQQGVDERAVRIQVTAYMRMQGAYQTIPVPFGSQSELRERFYKLHNQRFGFSPTDPSILIDRLSIEGIGNTGEQSAQHCFEANTDDLLDREVSLYVQGKWQQVPCLSRSKLTIESPLVGPAIIVDKTGTNVIESGWQVERKTSGALLLSRTGEKPALQIEQDIADPARLEIFNNAFRSIAEQMGVTLANTAYSVNIKERLDFSCALFDSLGNLVANAPHVPVHLGSMSESVKSLLQAKHITLRSGDVFMMNNPYQGGTHLPDVTVISPIFDVSGKTLLFFTAARGHHADIGGKTPGSSPADSQHIEEEGVLIDHFRLVSQGQWQETNIRDLLNQGRYPCRSIEDNLADLTAQVAANAAGQKALTALVDQYGLGVVQAYMKHVQANAEASVRQVISALKDSQFTYELDSGACIKVRIDIDAGTQSATIDFTGTSGQDAFNYNAPFSICRAVVLYVFRTLIDSDIPLNEGCLKPIKIIAPLGTFINPVYPAAVVAGNTEVSQAIAETLYGALGILAGSQGTMNNFTYGNDRFQNYETFCGGTGAGDGFHGTSGVHSHMTNTRMTDPEVLETQFPVRVDYLGIRQHSGGLGKWNGGNGIERHLCFLESATATVLSSHRRTQPYGVLGGLPGKTGENAILRQNGTHEPLLGNDQALLQSGDVFIIKTPGGGGYGAKDEHAE